MAAKEALAAKNRETPGPGAGGPTYPDPKELPQELLQIMDNKVDHMSVENVSLRRKNAMLQKKLTKLMKDINPDNPIIEDLSSIREESVDSDFSIERAAELNVSSNKDYFSVGRTQKGKANKTTYPVASSPTGYKAGE